MFQILIDPIRQPNLETPQPDVSWLCRPNSDDAEAIGRGRPLL